MKLFEVLNAPVPYEWTHSSADASVAKFKVDDKDVTVEFHEMLNPLAPEDYDPKAPRHVIDISFHVNTFNDGQRSADHYGITGDGDEYKIFATVMKITNDYISKYKPGALSFSADEPSRIKLYDRFVKRFTGKGYKVWSRESSHMNTYWVLQKT